jgi:putative transcriptional regulator
MELRTAPGTMLAASPELRDPNFMHSGVLMCQHADEGAYGLVVNRPAEVTVDKLLPEHPVLGRQAFPVFAGGPVGLDTLQFLHRAGEEIPGGLELQNGLWLGGDLDALAVMIAQDHERARQRVRLLVGYAGWGAGQLDAEVKAGGWLIAPGEPAAVFSTDPEGLWERAYQLLERIEVRLQTEADWNSS